jgi:DNA-binding NarL/FixJ family response regulator
MSLRVVLADDHRLVLDAVQRALEKDEGFRVVATTDSGAAVADLVARHRPDLVVIDLRMPGVDGLQALDQIRARDSHTKVVMLSASDRPEEIQSALSRGADGFIPSPSTRSICRPCCARSMSVTVFTNVVRSRCSTGAGRAQHHRPLRPGGEDLAPRLRQICP